MAGTRWVKIDTSYLRNPKITDITAPAVMLHLASILWTADQLMDGQIPKRAIAELGHSARIPRSALNRRIDELTKGNLWTPNGDGFHLHDFEVMNRQALRAVVERQRAVWRERKEQ